MPEESSNAVESADNSTVIPEEPANEASRTDKGQQGKSQRELLFEEYRTQTDEPVSDELPSSDDVKREEVESKAEVDAKAEDDTLKSGEEEDEYIPEDEAEEPEPEEAEKQVPLKALKEERSKRKDLQREVKDLRSQLDDVLTDLKEKMNSSEQADTDEGEEIPDDILDDPELAIRQLIKENRQLKSDVDAIKNKSQETEREEAARKNTELVNTISKELEAESFPGFEMFTSRVNEEIQKIGDAELKGLIEDGVITNQEQFNKQSARIIKKLNTPDRYKEIYKENTYSRLLIRSFR